MKWTTGRSTSIELRSAVIPFRCSSFITTHHNCPSDAWNRLAQFDDLLAHKTYHVTVSTFSVQTCVYVHSVRFLFHIQMLRFILIFFSWFFCLPVVIMVLIIKKVPSMNERGEFTIILNMFYKYIYIKNIYTVK